MDEKNYESNVVEIYEHDTLHVYLTARRKTTTCKECGSRLYIKEWKNRIISHSLLYGKPTIIHLRYPRLECKNCKKSLSEKYHEFPQS